MTEIVLEILRDGAQRERMAILPHIGLIRSPCFLEPLVRLLETPRRETQLFAAIALGSLESAQAVAPLANLLLCPSTLRGKACQSLQTALICALGETAAASGVEALRLVFDLETPGDRFALRRKALVVTAWGTLAQRGFDEALQQLLKTTESEIPTLREQAVTELGVAFWHKPLAIPDAVFEAFQAKLTDPEPEVRAAAEAALLNLAELGCGRAGRLLQPGR